MRNRVRRGAILLVLVGLALLVVAGAVAADGGNGGTGRRRPLSLATPITVGGGWIGFDFADVNSTSGPFTFTSSGPTVLKITDAYCTGDRFRVYDNGQVLGDTSATVLTACTFGQETSDPGVAVDHWAYSHAVFALGAGSHSITLRTLASPFGSGGAFLRVDGTGSQDRFSKPARWQNGVWTIGSQVGFGATTTSFAYGATLGPVAVVPLMCDWDGNSSRTPGVFVNGMWTIRNSNSAGGDSAAFSFGQAGDTPVCGDWDGDGTETIGVVRGNNWYLRNSNSTGQPDLMFTFGSPGDRFVVGDWDGDRRDTPGVFRQGTWFLRNSNSSGPGEVVFAFDPIWPSLPVVGDWDGDGRDTVGTVYGDIWFLRNSLSPGRADLTFSFGNPLGRPLVTR